MIMVQHNLTRDNLILLLDMVGVDIAGETGQDFIAYCFSGDTKFVTFDGIKTLKETCGSIQRVLSPQKDVIQNNHGVYKNGKWIDARVEYFGVQSILEVHLTRFGHKKIIRATPEHRWIKKTINGSSVVDTQNLKPGDRLASLTPKNISKITRLSPVGIAHGFVFGDGSRLGDIRHGCRVDLWGAKDAVMAKYFDRHPMSDIVTENGVRGIKVTGLPTLWKEFPDEEESSSYLFGWLAGYFAADGSVSGSNIKLESYCYENLVIAKRIATQLGMTTFNITAKKHKGINNSDNIVYGLAFSKYDMDERFFLIDNHRNNFNKVPFVKQQIGWTVESILNTGEVDDVYCVVVPETESFALEDFIWVMNCPFHLNRDTPALNVGKEPPYPFRCWNTACGLSGTIVEFMQKAGGMTMMQSLRLITKYSSGESDLMELLHKPEEGPQYLPIDESIMERLKITDDQLDQFRYMFDRGFTLETLRYFEVGFSKIRDRFTIPVRDLDGSLLGFSGRAAKAGQQPKYWDKGLPKRFILFNHQNAQRYDWVIIVEGPLDAMMVHQAGFPNVVSLLGGNLTQFQAKRLTRSFRSVTIFTDNPEIDEAGSVLGPKIAGVVKDKGRQVLFAKHIEGIKDPGDMTAAQISWAIENSEHMLLHQLRKLGGNIN